MRPHGRRSQSHERAGMPRPMCRRAAWPSPRAVAPLRASPAGQAVLAWPSVQRGAARGSVAPPRRPRGTRPTRSSRGSRRAGHRARPRQHRSSARRPRDRSPARPAARTSTGRACCAPRPPPSSGPGVDPSTGNGGRPPRRRGQDAAPARKRREASRDPPRWAEVMLRRSRRSLAKRPPSTGPQHNPPRNIIGLMFNCT